VKWLIVTETLSTWKNESSFEVVRLAVNLISVVVV